MPKKGNGRFGLLFGSSFWIDLQTAAMAEQAPPPIHEIVIVGDGRIGRAFEQMVMATPHRARMRRRGDVVVSGSEDSSSSSSSLSPILVATHCSHLDAVLERTQESRWKDLVFLQNGMLQPWLHKHGLEENTQALLYMSSAPQNPLHPKGTMIIKNGGRGSIVWGRWAGIVAQIMQSGGLECTTVSSREDFFETMWEKLLWSSIFWLLSDALGGLPVGTIAQKHAHHVQELTSELLPLLMIREPQNHSLFESEMVDRLCAYSNSIPNAVPSKSMALSEFAWRNGWFLARKVTPCHVKWLQYAGVSDYVL